MLVNFRKTSALTLSLLLLMANPSMAADTPSAGVGALARIEPVSRVVSVGPPNNFEGNRVEQLLVEEGQLVKKGDLLGRFSNFIEAQAELDVASSQLELEIANLEKVNAGNKRADVLAQEAKIKAIQSREENARREYERTKSLRNSQIISESRHDDLLSTWNSIKAERQSEEMVMKSLQTVRSDDIKIAEARVSVARAQKKQAEAKLSLTEIRAPFDGTILKIRSHAGETSSDQGILDIADLTSFDAVAEIFETDILKIKEGQKANVVVPGLTEPLPGVVKTVGWQVRGNSIVDSNPNKMLDTRVIEVRVRITAPKPDLLRHLINVKSNVTILQ